MRGLGFCRLAGDCVIDFIDLFAGIGGFHLGLTSSEQPWRDSNQDGRGERASINFNRQDGSEDNRFRCVWANEWDKYAAATYRKNFPETPLSTDDIRKVSADSVPDHDLLCAGFPCQAFSVAGKRRGLEEARGTLFYEIARIAERKRPRLLLLENVKGLLSHDEGRTFATILRVMGSIGYRLEWQVLNSKWFGVPQNRERVFIIGHLGEEPTRTVFPITEIGGTPLEQFGEWGEPAHTIDGNYFKGADNHAQRTLIMPVLTPDRPTKRQNGRRFKDDGEEAFTLTGQDVHGVMIHNVYGGFNEGVRVFDDISPTIRTPAGGGHLPYVANCVDVDGYLRTGARPRDKNGKPQLLPIGYRRIRRLTPVECERLQGFPDGWTEGVSDTQRYKQMGNAVTVNVIRFLGSRISELASNKEIEK
jgi:DNA (cytosine-5)-methyltransferase 1